MTWASSMTRCPWTIAFPLLLVSSFCGCGPANNRVAVEGVVTLDGKAVEGAAVTFIPKAGGRPGVAGTDAAGRFVIRDAGMHPGLPPGTYDVVIFKAVMAPLFAPAAAAAPPAPEDGLPPADTPPPTRISRWIVPERYSSPESNGLSATITGPTTSLVFALTTRE